MKAKRIQRKRTKGWKMPPNTVYVGRPSKWGNPYKVGMVWYGHPYRIMNNGRYINCNDEAVYLYENYGVREHEPEEIIKELKGKNLACWCKRIKCNCDWCQINPAPQSDKTKEWEKELYKLYTKDTDDWNYWKKWIGKILKSQREEIIKSVKKIPKYDFSVNGIDGEYYLVRDEVLELLKNI